MNKRKSENVSRAQIVDSGSYHDGTSRGRVLRIHTNIQVRLSSNPDTKQDCCTHERPI